MKKNLYLLLTLLFFVSCQKNNRFELAVSITGVEEEKIYLEVYKEQSYLPVDSVTTIQGKAQFNGELKHPGLFFLKVGNINKRIPLFLESGTISITGNIDTLENLRVEGSKTHSTYQNHLNQIKALRTVADSLYTELKKADEEKNTELASELEKKIDELDLEQTRLNKEFLEKNNNIVGLFILRRFLIYGMEYDELKSSLANIDKQYHATSLYNELQERLSILENIMPGKPAPEFSMETPNGDTVSLSSFKGKYLLLDFWASWCGPCRKANPHVVEIYQRYRNKNFTILGISLDNKRENWLAAIETDKLTWTHVSDLNGWKNRVARQYGINSIPRMFLISPEGVIIDNNVSHETLSQKLFEIFGE